MGRREPAEASPGCLPEDLEFDARWGVDTAGYVDLASLDIKGANWMYCIPYLAVPPEYFGNILVELPIAHAEFTFIDVGSGKGRAVLIASRHPFKKVIGVELTHELNAVAERNLALFPASERRCLDVELRCIDAMEFEFPDTPVVLYLYHPFDEPLMSRFVDKIVAFHRERHRRAIVLYFNDVHREVFENTGIFHSKKLPMGFPYFDTEPAGTTS
jgi:SAM-dependent methyltransferase